MRRSLLIGGLLAVCGAAQAAPGSPLVVDFGGSDQASYLRLVALFASISLAPALLAVLTAFLRIIIVLYFLRAGLGSHELLPNQVLMGLAIVLTLLAMARPLGEINKVAMQPLLAGRVSMTDAAEAAMPAARAYLSAHVREADLEAMMRYSPVPAGRPAPFVTLAAAHVLSELRAAFIIGFAIFLPFMVIDLVVAGTLASLGLVGMPQAMLALPFKILLFVMVDGWRLLSDTLLQGLA